MAKRATLEKCNNCKNIVADNYIFLPFACETLGPWCEEAVKFIESLGKILRMTTGDRKSKLYLKQRISLAIQRANAACVMKTFDSSAKLDEVYYIISNDFAKKNCNSSL